MPAQDLKGDLLRIAQNRGPRKTSNVCTADICAYCSINSSLLMFRRPRKRRARGTAMSMISASVFMFLHGNGARGALITTEESAHA